jgi:mono/diheme cytochrome c family protein
MNRFKLAGCSAAVVAAATLVTIGAAAAPDRKAGARGGAALYQDYGCYACHGHSGVGGLSSGPALAGRRLTAEHVVAYVRSPKGVMPPYRKGVLSDADLHEIARHVVAMPGARPVAQIPKLARLLPVGGATAGRPQTAAPSAAAQFQAHCAACHGSAGEGGAGPALTGESAKRSIEQTAALIRRPPPAMPTLTPDPIADRDVPALAAYVHGFKAR